MIAIDERHHSSHDSRTISDDRIAADSSPKSGVGMFIDSGNFL
jgi:hypothetical protein